MIYFSYPDQNDIAFSVNELNNKVTVVNFFFTSCPTICPTTTLNLIQLQNKLNQNKIDKFKIISISVDPNNDTPEVLKKYASSMDIDAIVVMSESGATARIVSHFRPNVNIYGLSPHIYICNRMSLLWGIIPIQTKSYLTTDDMLINAEKILLNKKYMKKGQTFVLTAGVPVGVSGSTNMIQIQKINKD